LYLRAQFSENEINKKINIQNKMATLERIRNKAGLLVIVVGLALFAFIIGDFLRSGSTFFRQSKEKVVIVDGESINIKDFQSRVEETTNMYKIRGNTSISEEDQNRIRQSVFEEVVGTILLDKVSERIGLAVGKDEIKDLIMGNNISPIILQIPDFQNPETGKFDKNGLLRFLQTIELDDLTSFSPEEQQQILQMKKSWLNVENSIIRQKQVSKLGTLIASAIVVNSLDAKAAYDDNAVSVDFNYVSQSYSTIPDSQVVVTNAEVEKLYNLRKTAYKQEKAKVIDYIAINVIPSEADFKDNANRLDEVKAELVTTNNNVADILSDVNSEVPYLDVYYTVSELDEDQLNFVREAQTGAVEGPFLKNGVYSIYKLVDVKQASDSVSVSLLPMPNYGDEVREKVFSDSLINVIKSGKSFTEVAQELTQGQFNSDLGWQTEVSLKTQGLDIKTINSLFEAKTGEVFTVKTTYSTILAQVSKKTSSAKKYKLATVQVTVTPSQETSNKLYTELNQYISKNNKLATFKEAAGEAGYVCQTNVQVFENQSNITSIKNSRQVIRWAFEHSKGDISNLFECEDYFIVAAVEGTLKEGSRSLSDVSEYLKRELINEKKGEKIVNELKAKNLSSLEDYATAMNTTLKDVKFVTFATPRITGVGIEPAVNAKAVSAEPEKLVGPIAGKTGAYVLVVTNKSTTDQAYDEKTQKEQLNQQNSYYLQSLIQNNFLLKENAKIEDYRIRFF
jgi:peptidyl-prolyl cis-trans isomerase D